MNSISSPTSHASCSTSQASYPDDLINSTLVSLFYLTSDGGFMSKNGYMPCHREKDGKLQIEVITNDYSFWIIQVMEYWLHDEKQTQKDG
ncbi:hypothetical protein AAE036_001379 [Salmonella enterica]|nr:hypothetical protein [Salmonella enterica subsp. diarizonae]EEA6010448.1 hypothetical protein [Salmonella enterica subsp. diarizonae]EFT1602795.1 hypothetical protein [Salmonella enterica]EIF0296004.1 hypothetical protein [Salmonella enterica]